MAARDFSPLILDMRFLFPGYESITYNREPMAGNPREHAKGKGFWDGGSFAQGTAGEGSGRARGFPGRKKITREGVQVDLTRPRRSSRKKKKKRNP